MLCCCHVQECYRARERAEQQLSYTHRNEMQELLCQAAGSLPHPSSRLMIHKRPMKVKDSLKCLLSAGIPKEAEGKVNGLDGYICGRIICSAGNPVWRDLQVRLGRRNSLPNSQLVRTPHTQRSAQSRAEPHCGTAAGCGEWDGRDWSCFLDLRLQAGAHRPALCSGRMEL